MAASIRGLYRRGSNLYGSRKGSGPGQCDPGGGKCDGRGGAPNEGGSIVRMECGGGGRLAGCLFKYGWYRWSVRLSITTSSSFGRGSSFTRTSFIGEVPFLIGDRSLAAIAAAAACFELSANRCWCKSLSRSLSRSLSLSRSISRLSISLLSFSLLSLSRCSCCCCCSNFRCFSSRSRLSRSSRSLLNLSLSRSRSRSSCSRRSITDGSGFNPQGD